MEIYDFLRTLLVGDGVGVQKPRKAGDDESAPALRIRDGADSTERLVEWHDRDQARAFVEWLLQSKLPVRKPAFRQENLP